MVQKIEVTVSNNKHNEKENVMEIGHLLNTVVDNVILLF